jgi:hypothetical protein
LILGECLVGFGRQYLPRRLEKLIARSGLLAKLGVRTDDDAGRFFDLSAPPVHLVSDGGRGKSRCQEGTQPDRALHFFAFACPRILRGDNPDLPDAQPAARCR